jgi:hypothetical protein
MSWRAAVCARAQSSQPHLTFGSRAVPCRVCCALGRACARPLAASCCGSGRRLGWCLAIGLRLGRLVVRGLARGHDAAVVEQGQLWKARQRACCAREVCAWACCVW